MESTGLRPAEIARLLRARRSGKGKWVAKCPAHKERTASLYITPGKDDPNSVWIHCFAGCSQADVLKAAGLTWKDLSGKDAIDRALRKKIADERKLERLLRRSQLMRWLASIDPGRKRYWEAAWRGVIQEMEPLYWEAMPDQARFTRIRRFEEKDYREKRMDWLYRKT